MSNSQGEAHVQTFGEAKSSIIDVIESSFASLAKMLGVSQLKESFYQNIIYILIVIVVMVGILVYIQMISGSVTSNPLFSPPTKQIKKVEIKRIVEGFDTEAEFNSINAASVSTDGGDGDDGTNVNDHNNTSMHETFSEHYENKKRR
jgi:hypothetical protein